MNEPSETAKLMAKLATVSQIMDAARLLHGLQLIDEPPAALVKRYVLANPDINEQLAKYP